MLRCRISCCALLIALGRIVFLAAPVAATETRPVQVDPGAPPSAILWVGNSFFYYNNSLLVIPADLAFARVLEANPGIELHDQDKRHPSLAGTYLAAATVYATLFRATPGEPSYTAGLDPQLAVLLRTAARETVEAYAGR
jgi:hypothetical protein